jgi:hypothetical protein
VIDRRLHSVPEHIGDEQDDDGAQRAVDEAGDWRIVSGEVYEIDAPAPGEHSCRADNQSARRPRLRLTAMTLGGPSWGAACARMTSSSTVPRAKRGWLAENYDLPLEAVREVLSFYDRHKLTRNHVIGADATSIDCAADSRVKRS